MPSKNLTDLGIKRLTAANKGTRDQFHDRGQPGLELRVTDTGSKSFSVGYYFGTNEAGRPKHRRITIGDYPTISLVDARAFAARARTLAKEGRDPKVIIEAERRRNVEVTAQTFEAELDAFLDHYANGARKRGTENELGRVLRRDVQPILGPLPLREITRADVVAVLDSMADRPILANRTLSFMRQFFRWAIERGKIQGANPTSDIKKPGKERARDRVLDAREIKVVWAALDHDEIDATFRDIVRMLLATAQRKMEVTAMTWDEIDPDAKQWTLARERTKSDRIHDVSLNEIALGIIEARLDGDGRLGGGLVFPGRLGTPFGGWTKQKAKLDEVSGITDWTLHDLRRTVATNLAALGVAPHVAEAVLNYSSGIVSGIAAVYNRHSYQQQKTEALAAWSRQLSAIIDREPDGSNVLPFQASGHPTA